MMEPVEIQDEEHEQILERVAAIDVAKATGMVCTRVPDDSRPGRRLSKVWEIPATTNAIIELGEYLAGLGIQKITLESTSDYWRPFYYLLDAAGLDVQLVRAQDVKQAPGRPKSDQLTELFNVFAGHKADCQRCGTAPTWLAHSSAGCWGTRPELTATRSGHAVRYRLPAFSSLLLVARAGKGRAAVVTALDQLICLVF